MGLDLSVQRYSQRIIRKKCPVIAAFTRSGNAVLVRCGLWTCPFCSRMNARKWARRVRLHLEANVMDWWFITLTFGSAYRVPISAFRVLPKLWDALRKEMQRVYPEWQFMAFVEGQAKSRGGMPHFHIISNKHVNSCRGRKGQWTQRGVHDWAVKRGFGFESSCKLIDSQEAGAYVAKYASKGDPSMPKKFRRVRSSHSWYKVPKDPSKKLIVPSKGEDLVHFLLRVQNISDVDLEKLYQSWREANDELMRINAPDDCLLEPMIVS